MNALPANYYTSGLTGLNPDINMFHRDNELMLQRGGTVDKDGVINYGIGGDILKAAGMMAAGYFLGPAGPMFGGSQALGTGIMSYAPAFIGSGLLGYAMNPDGGIGSFLSGGLSGISGAKLGSLGMTPPTVPGASAISPAAMGATVGGGGPAYMTGINPATGGSIGSSLAQSSGLKDIGSGMAQGRVDFGGLPGNAAIDQARTSLEGAGLGNTNIAPVTPNTGLFGGKPIGEAITSNLKQTAAGLKEASAGDIFQKGVAPLAGAMMFNEPEQMGMPQSSFGGEGQEETEAERQKYAMKGLAPTSQTFQRPKTNIGAPPTGGVFANSGGLMTLDNGGGVPQRDMDILNRRTIDDVIPYEGDDYSNPWLEEYFQDKGVYPETEMDRNLPEGVIEEYFPEEEIEITPEEEWEILKNSLEGATNLAAGGRSDQHWLNKPIGQTQSNDKMRQTPDGQWEMQTPDGKWVKVAQNAGQMPNARDGTGNDEWNALKGLGFRSGGQPTLEGGSFVIPADVVSGLGDGSSDAGHDTLSKWFQTLDNNYAIGGNTNNYISGEIKAAGGGLDDLRPTSIEGAKLARLSNDEFVIPNAVVTQLGGGSNKKGSENLYNFIKNVRLNKTGTGKQPPTIRNKGLNNLLA